VSADAPQCVAVAHDVPVGPSPFSTHRSSPSELKEQIEAERTHTPFLVYRDSSDAQQIVALDASAGRLRVGRDSMCEQSSQLKGVPLSLGSAAGPIAGGQDATGTAWMTSGTEVLELQPTG
jgi:hypothetical protein